MRVLVTGGAGFIGSNLVRKLLENRHEVMVLDNFSTGYASNLDGLDIELFEGDIRDAGLVEKAAAGCETVFHLAALPSVARSMLDPVTTADINITGTACVLNVARHSGVRRLVFSSSSSVYGERPEMVKSESLIPDPISPYAVSKLAGEHLCSVFNRVMGLETISLRYFNVFGPRQDASSEYSAVVPRFIKRIMSGQAPVIYGSGKQSRDFTPVSVAVEANISAATTPKAGGVYNVACGRSTSVLDLALTLSGMLGRNDLIPEHHPERPGDILHSLADITRLSNELGVKTADSLVPYLEDVCCWFTRTG